MSKPEKEGPAELPVPVKPITFRDLQYTSRTLILPDRRALAVTAKSITVEGNDSVAIAFFRKRSDFEQVRE